MKKTEKTSPVMYDRFLKGLDNYGLSREKVLHEWVYCGNNNPRCKKFESFYPDCELPDYEEHCICGQQIIKNHYITDGNGSILVIGSECINNFLQFSMGKRCSHCKQIHKNRKDNYCNECRRLPSCVVCKKKGNKYCYDCNMKRQDRIANTKCECGKRKREGYARCYGCQQIKNERYKKQKEDEIIKSCYRSGYIAGI